MLITESYVDVSTSADGKEGSMSECSFVKNPTHTPAHNI